MLRTALFSLRTTTAGLVLASCLFAAPAIGKEVFTWVDDEGVTHFGHAATTPKQTLAENTLAEKAASSTNHATGQSPIPRADIAHNDTKLALAQRHAALRR